MTTTRIEVRITDNVLDPADWPLGWVELDADVITANRTTKRGVYSFPFGPGERLMVGAPLAALTDWIAYDPTGEHPEVYYEARVDHGRWHGGCRSSAEALARELQGT